MQQRVPLLAVGLTALLSGAGCDSPQHRFEVRPSVEQIAITHAPPGATLTVYDRDGLIRGRGTADRLGSLLVRQIPAGAGYLVRADNGEYAGPLTVMGPADSPPPQSFYDQQRLHAGFNYIKTRDGTTLSAYVTLPGPIESGPYPTVVNYSGYDPSKPGQPLKQFDYLCRDIPTLCDPPSDPSGLIASLFGFATVSVNIRGTGCSGGAYDYFETLQRLDGYDVIETVAAQDFAQFHKVGMTGLSFPGIAQLFVAATRPPSLAAITPLSVIGDTGSTLVPGGILNNGFAVDWVNGVLNEADPYGQGWEAQQVGRLDLQCAENQLLHGQKRDNVAEAYNTPYNEPARTDPLSPQKFVSQINVPVFLAGAWQDEQTGPSFTLLLDQFKSSPLVRLTVYNGVHPDGFAPQVLSEWYAFLSLTVAHRVPALDPKVRQLAPILFDQIFGASVPLPADRWQGFSRYEDAMLAYQKEPPLRAIFENGGGPDPGAPAGLFEARYASWPPPQKLVRYYLQGDGSLQETPPTAPAGGPGAASAFKLDSAAGQRVVLAPGGDVFNKLPRYDYRQLSPGRAVVFETAAFTSTQVFLGTGSADLWIRSSADDADLQVTVTEVRPDGNERYVQSGWLRASHRALAPESTPLAPAQTHLRVDAAPLPAGAWTLVRVPISGFGHAFRAGSRLRLAVDTPGDVRARWRFLLKQFPGEVTHSVAHAAAYPSSVALPLVATPADVPAQLPACPSLRGQPCRPYMPYTNTPAP